MTEQSWTSLWPERVIVCQRWDWSMDPPQKFLSGTWVCNLEEHHYEAPSTVVQGLTTVWLRSSRHLYVCVPSLFSRSWHSYVNIKRIWMEPNVSFMAMMWTVTSYDSWPDSAALFKALSAHSLVCVYVCVFGSRTKHHQRTGHCKQPDNWAEPLSRACISGTGLVR